MLVKQKFAKAGLKYYESMPRMDIIPTAVLGGMFLGLVSVIPATIIAESWENDLGVENEQEILTKYKQELQELKTLKQRINLGGSVDILQKNRQNVPENLKNEFFARAENLAAAIHKEMGVSEKNMELIIDDFDSNIVKFSSDKLGYWGKPDYRALRECQIAGNDTAKEINYCSQKDKTVDGEEFLQGMSVTFLPAYLLLMLGAFAERGIAKRLDKIKAMAEDKPPKRKSKIGHNH